MLQAAKTVTAALLLLGAAPSLPGGVEEYDVVWETPSGDWHGSMPLGNGDIALNLWVEPGGDLRFFIAKTDAWDDSARLVKVGAVRLRLDPNPFAPGKFFRQALRLREGTVKIMAGEGRDATYVWVWVDALAPAVYVEVSGPPCEATASIDLWRTKRIEITDLQVSDVLVDPKSPGGRRGPIVVEPDTVLSNLPGRIGWCHRNVKSVGPKVLAEVQGLADYPQADPLLGRTFGALIGALGGERIDDLHLRSPRKTGHRFSIAVLTRHPSTPEAWLAEAEAALEPLIAEDITGRRDSHCRWWADFWDRSWIRAKVDPGAARPPAASPVPANSHPLRIGVDQAGENRFSGEIGRLRVLGRPLAESEIAALARGDRKEAPGKDGAALFEAEAPAQGPVEKSAGWTYPRGLTVEAWVKPAALPGSGARIADKITPGGVDGFLLDTFPGNGLRFICGRTTIGAKDAAPAGAWTHVAAVVDPAEGAIRLYAGGARAASASIAGAGDEAFLVSRMYHLQRYITACAGRGAYPIKFNGSLFTVPAAGATDPDYRRWGPGYWWQNTRLPYIGMCAAGDFDLMEPLIAMYAGEVLRLSKFRTRKYCGHEGAFFPECIYFWGPIFSETYGWTPFEERTDKLQESGWHKWEWVGGLELAWLFLDRYEHTLDEAFLRKTAIPFAREILTFFERHYRAGPDGKLVLRPSQALETWWECTNAMPELAGLIAVTDRLLALPAGLTAPGDRAAWERLRAMLPPLPLRDVGGGAKALAPAEKFAAKRNVENPELYAVFPFRLIAAGKPNVEWGIEALKHRWDRGHFGWRQDDIFMAYLGLAEEARAAVVERAGNHDPNERFPAFWGPNYDWTPDQDHGGVLMKAFQAMVLQTDGSAIRLLPAWPPHWDVSFKLHAPGKTILECVFRGGKVRSLKVTPESRAKDVVIPEAFRAVR